MGAVGTEVIELFVSLARCSTIALGPPGERVVLAHPFWRSPCQWPVVRANNTEHRLALLLTIFGVHREVAARRVTRESGPVQATNNGQCLVTGR